jgi:hypothetical protein
MARSDDLHKRVVKTVVLGWSRNAVHQAFQREHRKRGAPGDALQDHGQNASTSVLNSAPYPAAALEGSSS